MLPGDAELINFDESPKSNEISEIPKISNPSDFNADKITVVDNSKVDNWNLPSQNENKNNEL